MVTLYGIKTCDTCRKARTCLKDAGIEHQWVDLREDGVDAARLKAWRDALGNDALLNKRSQTWRDFNADQRSAAEADPVTALIEHPTLAKRPILETATNTLAGFSDARYRAALAGAD